MKKFLLRLLIFALPFCAMLAYCYIFFQFNYMTGDLGRIGEIPFGKEYGQSLINNYPHKDYTVNYSNDKELQNYAVFSFGDSSSQGKIAGYQNYVGHILNDSVLNIVLENTDGEQSAIGFLNAGFFDSDKTKFVVIESGEREFIHRLQHLDFSKTINIEKEKSGYYNDKDINPSVDTLGIRGFDSKRVYSWIRGRIGIYPAVKKTTLGIKAFSHETQGEKLYFYKDDLGFTRYKSHEIEQAKVNLIKMHKLFAEKGIRMIYVVAADKYDVYSEFIVNNPYPENHTLDYFGDLSQENWFINTKDLLQPKVREGHQDIYKVNDTHWSYIGHRLVAEEVVLRYRAW